jgi:hypothetical protein
MQGRRRVPFPRFYLRKIEVAPNGHKNATRRKLRDKGSSLGRRR